MTTPAITKIPISQARAIWLQAQRLDQPEPFGRGPEAVRLAVEQLGYVQIDTIHVIERSHHHILHNRIADYQPADLQQAQAVDKSVFEYWTHALAYVPTRDYRMYVAAMDQVRAAPSNWLAGVDAADYAALLRRIRREGPLSIRDIDDPELVEKTHPWASRKPSKRALQLGFYNGELSIASRDGMLKSYDLSNRHFGWRRRPAPVSAERFAAYLLQRGLRAQGIVSLDSICYGSNPSKPAVQHLLEAEVAAGRLREVALDGQGKSRHWLSVATLDTLAQLQPSEQVHLLSPFDPVVIQRKRLALFFGYQHRFEAYVPPAQRVQGYFALPVLVGDQMVAAIDLKMDRQRGQLLLQQWTWLVPSRANLRRTIEAALGRFEDFQKRCCGLSS